jgi:hypothetical protein
MLTTLGLEIQSSWFGSTHLIKKNLKLVRFQADSRQLPFEFSRESSIAATQSKPQGENVRIMTAVQPEYPYPWQFTEIIKTIETSANQMQAFTY